MSEENKVEVMPRNEVSDLERIEKAQIDQLVATAKHYPRNIKDCKTDAIALATMDSETARECFYSLRRAGKNIEGPSIRCAEIVASQWGNLRAGSRVLKADATTITAQAFCHDTERNVFVVKETKRRITNRDGKRYNEDMIVMTGNAAASIAHRNAVFSVIPKAIVRAVWKAAKQVAVGKAGSLKDRWAKCVEQFGGIPVSEEQILGYLNKKSADEVNQEDLAHMIGVFTALKEEEATVEELFPTPKEVETKVGEGKPVAKKPAPEKNKKAAKPKKDKPKEKKEPEPETKEPAKEGGPFAAPKGSGDQNGLQNPE